MPYSHLLLEAECFLTCLIFCEKMIRRAKRAEPDCLYILLHTNIAVYVLVHAYIFTYIYNIICILKSDSLDCIAQISFLIKSISKGNEYI